MEKRSFYAPDIDISALAHAMADSFSRDGYQTQVMPTANGGATIQARKEDTLRKIAGMSSALTVNIAFEGDYVGVEVGGAKWADKGAAGAVGALIFFPVLITAGVGAYQQSQLQSKAWQFIDQYIKSNSTFGGSAMGAQTIPPFPGQQPMQPVPGAGQPASPPPLNMGRGTSTASTTGQASAGTCTQCGHAIPPGARFCGECGTPVARTCKSCQHVLPPNAKFCDNCGNPVG
jgi:RNA polymerase subunit RPABC4/transcription elongation factor Spt4